MWRTETEAVAGGARYRLIEDGEPMSFRRYLGRLGASADFGDWYTGLLADSGFEAFFWEHPPLTVERLDAPAEFVLIASTFLAAIPADGEPFAEHFRTAAGEPVIVFANLGGDATLVVPAPGEPASAYAHLGAFLRSGPREQVHALWRIAATSVDKALGAEPLWFSTAGLGVAWAHLRLDTRPKYYRYAPYTEVPTSG